MSNSTGFMRSSPTLTVYAVLAVVYLYAPILLLIAFSFHASKYISLPFKGFSLQWYEAMFANDGLHLALWNSLQVGAVAALGSTLIATLAAKAISRYRFPGKMPIVALVTMPTVMPEVILGIGLLILLNGIGLTLSLMTVAIGHIIICTPFALAVMLSRFQGYDPAYEEASLDLGETPFTTFFRVTLPLVWPGIVSSLLLTFLISFDDFVVTFFLTGTDQTLPMFMWGQMRFADRLPTMLALGSIIMVLSFIVLVLVEILRRHGNVTATAARA